MFRFSVPLFFFHYFWKPKKNCFLNHCHQIVYSVRFDSFAYLIANYNGKTTWLFLFFFHLCIHNIFLVWNIVLLRFFFVLLSENNFGQELLLFFRTSIESSPSDPRQSPSPNLLTPVSPVSVIPPPPPPPAPRIDQLKLPGCTSKAEIKKNVPKPSGALKTLNWSVIPHSKIPGTVWEKIDDEKLYQQVGFWEKKIFFFTNHFLSAYNNY